MINIPRHDPSKPFYQKFMEDSATRRKEQVAWLVRDPSLADFPLENIRREAAISLAVDPDSKNLITWESWSTYMQAAEALFAASTAPRGDHVERMIDQEVRNLPSVEPSHFTDAGNWETAFFLALTCRDENRIRFLCDIPVELLKEAGESDGGSYDKFLYYWISALQDFTLDRPTLVENLTKALELSAPGQADISSSETLDKLVFPPMNTLLRLAQRDSEEFNKGLAQGLRLFHDYYTATEERSKDLNGVVPLALLALACLACDISDSDPDFQFEVESGYLPKHIIRQSWYGEFPI